MKLPDAVKAHIHAGRLSAGHARMLIGQDNAAELAQDIVERGLNVRQVEALAQQRAARDGKSSARRPRAGAGKDADTLALEKRVSDALGLTVSIDASRRVAACCTSITAASTSSKTCCGAWSGRSRNCRYSN